MYSDGGIDVVCITGLNSHTLPWRNMWKELLQDGRLNLVACSSLLWGCVRTPYIRVYVRG